MLKNRSGRSFLRSRGNGWKRKLRFKQRKTKRGEPSRGL